MINYARRKITGKRARDAFRQVALVFLDFPGFLLLYVARVLEFA